MKYFNLKRPVRTRMRFVLFAVGLACLVSLPAASQHQALQSQMLAHEREIDRLLTRMTLEEKVGQLNLISARTVRPPTDNPNHQSGNEPEALIAAGSAGSVVYGAGAEATNRLQRLAVEKSRMHIPLLFGADVIHGYKTVYPVPIALAATFDPEIVEAVSRVAAREASSAGIRWFYSPMVDVARDARWGRIVEGAGEDPFLGSALARAYVRGYQGHSLADQGSVAATAKHFAGYGAVEGGRDYNTTDMSVSRLWQTYLPPFRAAVDEGVASIMAAFTSLNGVPATENAYLLQDVLKRQWGFAGPVVSDYNAVAELLIHGTELTPASAAAHAMQAGLDIDLISDLYRSEVPQLVRSGKIPVKMLDDAARRVLRVKFALGLFDRPYTTASPEVTHPAAADRQVARVAAERSFVLLKNSGVLPLRPHTRVLLVGPFADNAEEMLGPWARSGDVADVITLRKALTERCAGERCSLQFLAVGDAAESADAMVTALKEASRNVDAIVLALGEPRAWSGEAASRARLRLPESQLTLLRQVASVGKPVATVLFGGRPLVLTDVVGRTDALLEAWYPGIEAGTAITSTLFGDVSPSGKLPVSFPRDEGQEPLFYEQLPTGRPSHPDSSGADAHFTSRYIDVADGALFPFGFGLTYTIFRTTLRTGSTEQRSIAELNRNGTIPLDVMVKNIGIRAAASIVSCYVSAVGIPLEQPEQSLRAFSRIELQPGQERAVHFIIRPKDLAIYDNGGRAHLYAGRYSFYCGELRDRPVEVKQIVLKNP